MTVETIATSYYSCITCDHDIPCAVHPPRCAWCSSDVPEHCPDHAAPEPQEEDYPTFCVDCGEPRNIAELDKTGRCAECALQLSLFERDVYTR